MAVPMQTGHPGQLRAAFTVSSFPRLQVTDTTSHGMPMAAVTLAITTTATRATTALAVLTASGLVSPSLATVLSEVAIAKDGRDRSSTY